MSVIYSEICRVFFPRLPGGGAVAARRLEGRDLRVDGSAEGR